MLKILVQPNISFPIRVPSVNELLEKVNADGVFEYIDGEYDCTFLANQKILEAVKYIRNIKIHYVYNLNSHWWSYYKVDTNAKLLLEYYHINRITNRINWGKTIKINTPVIFDTQEVKHIFYHSVNGFYALAQRIEGNNIYVNLNNSKNYVGVNDMNYYPTQLTEIPSKEVNATLDYIFSNKTQFNKLVDNILVHVIDGVCSLIDRDKI